MRTSLTHATLFQNKNFICVYHCGQSMSNEDRCTVLCYAFKTIQNILKCNLQQSVSTCELNALNALNSQQSALSSPRAKFFRIYIALILGVLRIKTERLWQLTQCSVIKLLLITHSHKSRSETPVRKLEKLLRLIFN